MALANETFEQLLLRGLQGNLQDQLFEKLVKDRMSVLRAEVEAITRAEVEKYTIESVHRLRDHLNQHEEVRVMLGYKTEVKK